MMGLGVLKGLLAATPAPASASGGFVHVDVGTAAAMYAARKIDLSTIAALSDDGLREASRRAIAASKDILWIGMAPKDVRVVPEGFTAIVKLRIDGEDRERSVLLRGDADNRITSAAEIGATTDETKGMDA